MPLSKMECPFVPLGASSWTHVPKPLYKHRAPCAEGRVQISSGGGGLQGEGPGCFLGVTPCGNHWGPMVPRSSGFQQCLSGVLEALGTSEHLFPEADSENTQGTVQLG